MKIEKRSENSYRVRTQVKGSKYTLVFDHKPSKTDINIELAKQIENNPLVKDSFNFCAKAYIKSKDKVLSPSTIKGYTSLLDKVIPEDFKKKKISDISQIDIQLVINEYAEDHKPKTVRNLHGFISSVMKQYRPNMIINTTLPQRVNKEAKIPTDEEVKKVLDMSSGTMFHIALQLGALGMRRSEICAASIDDIEGNILHINKALVINSENKWIIKSTKTAAGTRDIYLPDSLVEEIKELGYIYNGWPNSIYSALQDYCKKLGIEPFRFHDLRHFYASYAHEKGMSDADIMASGGWKSDYTMKTVYRHSIKKSKEDMQKQIAASIFL